MEKIKVGTIKLGAKVKLTDPCYDIEMWGDETIPTREGEYECSFKNKGERVACLIVENCDYKEEVTVKYESFGVDSGQAGIFDYEYYKESQPDKEWYKRVCDITLKNDCGCIDQKGVVSSSGFGDGSYSCVVKYDTDGNAVYFELVYLND